MSKRCFCVWDLDRSFAVMKRRYTGFLLVQDETSVAHFYIIIQFLRNDTSIDNVQILVDCLENAFESSESFWFYIV